MYNKESTALSIDEFSTIVHKALNQTITERVNDRLNSIPKANEKSKQDTESEDIQLQENKVVTTEDELNPIGLLEQFEKENFS